MKVASWNLTPWPCATCESIGEFTQLRAWQHGLWTDTIAVQLEPDSLYSVYILPELVMRPFTIG